MNLTEKARLDNRAILSDNVRKFSTLVDLENLVGGIQIDVPAFNIRVTQSIDPETGFIINDKKSALNINLNDISIGDPQKGWQVIFTDSQGDVLSGKVIRVDPERTFGYASLIVGV